MKDVTLGMAAAAKVGSILVHVEEVISDEDHAFDLTAIRALLDDQQVQAFIALLRQYALVPVKRENSKAVRQEER